jgi:uncharacterized protein YbjQ (UPF0145 family)
MSLNKILLSTNNTLRGKKVIRELGMVTGSSVHARSFLHDVWSRVIAFFGGEIPTYTVLVNRTTNESAKNMLVQADQQGANAIVNIRYQTNVTSDPTAGVMCYSFTYGTALIVEDNIIHRDGYAIMQEEEMKRGAGKTPYSPTTGNTTTKVLDDFSYTISPTTLTNNATPKKTTTTTTTKVPDDYSYTISPTNLNDNVTPKKTTTTKPKTTTPKISPDAFGSADMTNVNQVFNTAFDNINKEPTKISNNTSKQPTSKTTTDTNKKIPDGANKKSSDDEFGNINLTDPNKTYKYDEKLAKDDDGPTDDKEMARDIISTFGNLTNALNSNMKSNLKSVNESDENVNIDLNKNVGIKKVNDKNTQKKEETMFNDKITLNDITKKF